jgi:proteasome lid subunit RPN8/RPN11
VILTPREREAIERQAIEEYPNECCGVIVVRGPERRWLRCRNAQDEFHARDPERFPRTARSAFNISRADLEQIEQLQIQGFELVIIYHSHVDVGAYFSETDQRMAMMGRDPKEHDPLYPEVTHVVLAVKARRIDGLAAFLWDAERRGFLPIDLGAAERSGSGSRA